MNIYIECPVLHNEFLWAVAEYIKVLQIFNLHKMENGEAVFQQGQEEA